MDITVATPEPVEPVVILTLTMAEAQRLSAVSWLLETGQSGPRLHYLLTDAGVPNPLAWGSEFTALEQALLRSSLEDESWLSPATVYDRIGG